MLLPLLQQTLLQTHIHHNNTLTNNEKLGDGLGNLVGYVGANKFLNRLDAHIYKK